MVLVHAQDEMLGDLVGPTHERIVEEYLAQNCENVERRVRVMIERAQRRVTQAKTSPDAAAELAKLAADFGLNGEFRGATKCPACEDDGMLLGDHVGDSDVVYDHEDLVAVEYLTVLSDDFECESCGLLLVGPEYLAAAGLPEQFETHRDYDPVWDDYGND